MMMAITSLIIALVLWKGTRTDDVTTMDWTKLFWWSLVTHPLLDCHTTWGTQLFWPLPVKVSYNNIFVVDPLYTVPYLICVALAMFFNRSDPRRRWINNFGLVISSAYMLLTIIFKFIGYRNVRDSVERQGLSYSEISTRPTPFNSILWTMNINSGDHYYLGYHSLLDSKPEVDLVAIPKQHELLGQWSDNEKVHRLIRLSENNYIIRQENDTLVFCDLRFGQMGAPSPDKPFVYAYKLIPEGNDLRVELKPPPNVDGQLFKAVMGELWTRIKGE